MRNLKRALSLALASVMLLGMMVVGTSAASYPDVDENDNVEAIEVLNAVKVMIGDRGNFKPDAPVNRHEMAVIMAKLVLGNDTADNYVGTHPFTDVASWADKYVAACYENGIVYGTSKTTFGGDQPLTAVQAAAFMLRALGYKDLSKGEADWSVPVTATANQIRLFNGVASNPKAELDRNQVAQLALNTLKSPVVDLKDGTFTATDGDGKLIISGGSREYIVRSSLESYAYAINDVERSGNSASQISGATIELGEHLYNGKLRLNNSDMDVFGRPARTWEYDGKVVGTYVKEELLRKEYSVKVTGSDLYELLTQNTIDNYRFFISIDGETEESVLSSYGYFDTDDMYRSNKDGVGKTDKGVTTEVYVDATNKRVYISVINTYLAKAEEDYDEKNDDLDLTVYSIDEFSRDVYVKNKASDETMKVEGENFAIKDVKEDDFFLVTVADGEIQTMKAPEILSEEIINAFKLTSWVKTSAAQYDYASTAKYDEEVLDDYDVSNMKNLTYNIILDKYGYLIGLERNEDPDQYVFLTGIDSTYSEITSRTAKANVIFMDGSMKTVTVNVKDSNLPTFNQPSQANTWCKYTVNGSDQYTLKQVALSGATSALNDGTDGNPKVTVAQYAQNVGGGSITIDQKHVSLRGTDSSYVYGNDKTVYLNADMDYLQVSGTPINRRYVIDDVESLNTGVKNVKITVSELGASKTNPKDLNAYTCPTNEIYTLYNDKGFVIAAVTIGENEGVASNYAYVISSNVGREEYGHGSTKASDGKWLWTREVVVNGKITDLTEEGDTLQYIGPDAGEGNMIRGRWYEVKYDANGNVRKSEEIVFTTAGDKFVNLVADVEKASETHDVVLMADTTTVERLSWSNNQVGTLWTDTANSKGFSVSPEVKLVLCLANKDGKIFDKNSDVYEGYSGVKQALSDMNATAPYATNNGTRDVEVSAILENGVATTIVINDKVPEPTGNDKPSNTDKGTDWILPNWTDLIVEDGHALTPKKNIKVAGTYDKANQKLYLQFNIPSATWSGASKVRLNDVRIDEIAGWGSGVLKSVITDIEVEIEAPTATGGNKLSKVAVVDFATVNSQTTTLIPSTIKVTLATEAMVAPADNATGIEPLEWYVDWTGTDTTNSTNRQEKVANKKDATISFTAGLPANTKNVTWQTASSTGVTGPTPAFAKISAPTTYQYKLTAATATQPKITATINDSLTETESKAEPDTRKDYTEARRNAGITVASSGTNTSVGGYTQESLSALLNSVNKASLDLLRGTTQPGYVWAGVTWTSPKIGTDYATSVTLKVNGHAETPDYDTANGILHDYIGVGQLFSDTACTTACGNTAGDASTEAKGVKPLGTGNWTYEITWTFTGGSTITETYTVSRVPGT